MGDRHLKFHEFRDNLNSLIFNLQLREAELLVNIVRRVCRT